MPNSWRQIRLPEIVSAMASRPRHEALRGLITELLRDGFDARFAELEHERYLIDNRGRVDVAWGVTVIELKSDLRNEERDVLARMPTYLQDAASRSGSDRAPVGLATDGADILAYTLEDDTLIPIGRYRVDPEHPERLLGWLEPLIAPQPDVRRRRWRSRSPSAVTVWRSGARGTVWRPYGMSCPTIRKCGSSAICGMASCARSMATTSAAMRFSFSTPI